MELLFAYQWVNCFRVYLMSLRTKILLLLFFLFAVSIINLFLTFKLEAYGKEKLKWVIHTHEVLIQSERLLNSLTDAETGQRGFLLTENVDYLEPYYTGLSNIESNFNALLVLTSDNQVQQDRLGNINKFIKLKLAELSETIEKYRKDDNEKNDALELVKQNSGKKHMDSVRRLLKEFSSKEVILLERRKGDYRESRAHITTLIAVEIVFYIFMAIVSILVLNRNLFSPLSNLLSSTKKVEKGEEIRVSDLLTNDEMGYLQSSFYEMRKKYKKEQSS